MNLMYPVPTEEPAIAGIGWTDNRRLHDLVESIIRNVGDSLTDVKESGSTDWETNPKTSNAVGESQRGHSTRSAGKPRTWGRVTAYWQPSSNAAGC
jgi:hypothetical protein